METTATNPSGIPQAAQAPIFGPQNSALATPANPTEETGGADALAGFQPSLAPTIAKNTIAAGQINHGDARDWAENAVAGVTAALAGFGAGTTPENGGAINGIGNAARQVLGRRDEQQKVKMEQAQRQTENQQRQQGIDIEKQRLGQEQTNADRDYNLRLAESARQQAQSVREMSEHDARMQQMKDEHDERSYTLMHQDITFRQQQMDRENALKEVGAKPLKVAGQDAPEFDDLGKMEEYATANGLGANAHDNGYRTQPVLGADGKYKLYEVPDSGPEWHDVKGADGKTTKIFADPLGVLNYQEKVAQVHEANARANLTYVDAKKAVDDLKDEGTAKKAREDLTKLGGDYSKLPPGDKEALTADAQKRFQVTENLYQAALSDMRKDPDYANVPIDEKSGNVQVGSPEYRQLAEKYHVFDANDQLGAAYDTLRQLGYGYQKPGAGPGNEITVKEPGTVGNPGAVPKPGKPGDKLNAEGAQSYLKAAGGDKAKAAQMAQHDGWDINQ